MESGRYAVRLLYHFHLSRNLTISTDLHKTYIDDEHYNSSHGHAYEKYGVDSEMGAVVIVRPDQCKCTNRGIVLDRGLTLQRCIEDHNTG